MRLDDDDDRGLGRGRRVVGELADAAGDQDPDVRLAAAGRPEPGGAHRLVEARGDLVVGERHGSASIAADFRSRRMWRSKRNGSPL